MEKLIDDKIMKEEYEKWARFLYKIYTKEKTKERNDPSYHSKILDIKKAKDEPKMKR